MCRSRKKTKSNNFRKTKTSFKLNNITLLENTINLIKALGIEKIILNTFHLKHQIKAYLNENKFNISIDILEEEQQILDTGGGIMNMINSSKEENFLIFNPDTVWNSN